LGSLSLSGETARPAAKRLRDLKKFLRFIYNYFKLFMMDATKSWTASESSAVKRLAIESAKGVGLAAAAVFRMVAAL
jgi:hypothetical protein